jgi:hypothetical protein
VTVLAFAVMTLAVVRATRLVTTDDLTEPMRRWLGRRFPPYRRTLTYKDGEAASHVTVPSFVVRLSSCDWCVSVYLAAVAALVGKWTHMVPTWQWIGWSWLGMAGGAGLLLGWQ